MNRIYHLGFLPKNKSVASLGLVHTVLKVEPEKISCRDDSDDWTEKVQGFHGFGIFQPPKLPVSATLLGKTEATTTAEKPHDKWRTQDSPHHRLRFTVFC